MTEVRGTQDLQEFNKTWAPHSGSPKVFPKQLAVAVNSELERALTYAVHLDTCARYDFLAEFNDNDCTCGLVDLQRYVRKLAPHKYDADGRLKPEYTQNP
jgi:hypothetical protein